MAYRDRLDVGRIISGCIIPARAHLATRSGSSGSTMPRTTALKPGFAMVSTPVVGVPVGTICALYACEILTRVSREAFMVEKCILFVRRVAGELKVYIVDQILVT